VIRPDTLEAARSASGEYRAGGTDLQARRRLGLTGGETIDLGAVADLVGIRSQDEGLRVGSMTRITTLATHEIIVERYPGLALAAGSLATPQIRAVGTVGGNLLQRNRCPYFRHPTFTCHKSGGSSCPARDGDHRHGVIFDLGPCVSPHPSTLAMVLMVYESTVEVTGARRLSIGELVGDGRDGRRDHQLPGGEVLVAVDLPPAWEGESAAYRRAAGRLLAEWPIVEAVCRLEIEGSVIRRARVGVGGVAPVPLRRFGVEQALENMAVDDRSGHARAAELATEGATPLPLTGHKMRLLQNVVLDTVRGALAGDALSELAVGERPLPARPIPG
jgi:xanthine dehydrogenase YagS FAD-binding subunit